MTDMEEIDLSEEQYVIGSILSKPHLIDEIQYVNPRYFQYQLHQKIMEVIYDFQSNGKEITALNVVKVIGKEHSDYIAKISSIFGSKQKLGSYVKNIIEDGSKRIVTEEIKELLEKAKDPSFDIRVAIQNININTEPEKKDFKQDTIKTLEWKMNHKDQRSGISSGIKCFDEKINGFNGGCLYICAGRSSMGKSAFMTSLISKIEKDTPVGIISLEMTGRELYNRVCSIRANIPYWVVDRGRTTDEQFERFIEQVEKTDKLFIDDRGGLNCQQVCASIRYLVKKNACKIVFVDHLGLIKVDERGNLAHAIGNITATLKTLSKELNIAIVAICQVNRGVEGERDRRPKLSDLRDSGRIEEDADCVFFLYRDEYYNPIYTDKEKKSLNRYEKAEILVQKNRNGACGRLNIFFDNQLMKFYE